MPADYTALCVGNRLRGLTAFADWLVMTLGVYCAY